MASTRKTQIVGWILSFILAAFMGFSASGKFRDFPGKEEMFKKFAYPDETMLKIGVVEILITIVFLIPQTAFLGTILLTGYMGGAIATHVRVGDVFVIQLVIGVLFWIAYALRRPDVIRAAFSKPVTMS
jgi:DoxX-like family